MTIRLQSFQSHNVVANTLTSLQEKLFDIVHHGRLKDLQDLLRKEDVTSEDLKAVDSSGISCLGKAVQLQHTDVIKLLLQKGADVNFPDFYGQTAIQRAADSGSAEIAAILIEAGADVDWADGLSALHIASCVGHTEVADLLIKAGADINATVQNRVSVLHCAVSNGHHGIVKLLLAAKAKVNVQGSRTSKTPLFMAVDAEDEELVELLLKHGAKPNMQDDFGMTVLCRVCLYNWQQLAFMLMRAGAKVDIKDRHDNGPLHYAARNGNVKLCEELLVQGAKTNEMNVYQESPLHLAVRMNHMNVIKLLIVNGADTSLCHPSCNLTPVSVAVDAISDPLEFEAILQMLLLGGANLDTIKNEKTALWRAVEEREVAIAILLIQYGADVNMEGPHGITVLHKACRLGLEGLVETLLHAGLTWSSEIWLHNDAYSSGISLDLIQGYAHGIPMALHNKLGLLATINTVRFSTQSLLHLSRLAVRQAAGSRIYQLVTSLQLPTKVTDFVMLKVL